MNLLENQKRLQAQGKKLLADPSLAPILEKYGRIEIGGSYVYGLMSHPDLDLTVISESITKEGFGEFVGALTSLLSVRRVRATDRVNHVHIVKKAIKGFWIGLEMDFENEAWNIDIWFQEPAWQNDNTKEWHDRLETLGDIERIAVLRIKEELRAQGRYGVGKKYVGVDVYRAVLNTNIRTVAELDALS